MTPKAAGLRLLAFLLRDLLRLDRGQAQELEDHVDFGPDLFGQERIDALAGEGPDRAAGDGGARRPHEGRRLARIGPVVRDDGLEIGREAPGLREPYAERHAVRVEDGRAKRTRREFERAKELENLPVAHRVEKAERVSA